MVNQDNGFQELDDDDEEAEFTMASLESNIRHDAVLWLDGIPDDWAVQIHSSKLQMRFGDRFVRQGLGILLSHLGSADALTRELSWVEIATWFHLEVSDLPIPHKSYKGYWRDADAGTATTQTLAATTRLVKDFFKELSFCFSLEMPDKKGINILSLRIHTPLQGTLVRIREIKYQEVAQTLLKFNARRPIRRANDLTRPLPR